MSLSVVVQGSDQGQVADCRRALAGVAPGAQIVLAGPGAAGRNAGLRQATGEYVTFLAATDRLTGGLRLLIESLERSGSDLAVGFLAKPDDPKRGGHPLPLRWPPARAVTLAERPDLVRDAAPLAKVFRRSFLIDGAVSWPERPGDDLLGTIRAYAAARTIDIVDTAVSACRATSAACWSVGLADWAADAAAVADLLAGHHPADVVFAEDAVQRQFPVRARAIAAAAPALKASVGSLFRRFVETAPPGAPTRLPLQSRWALARCVLADGRGDLPVALSASLGLGDLSLGEAERTRFAVRAPRPWPAAADVAKAAPATPEVSVVIATHDVAEYVDELLHSLRAASGVALEIVVVDDHSTDGTWQKVQAHAVVDPRIRAHRSLGRGVGPARNQGTGLATGEYLAFADGDGIVPPHGYEALLAAARRTRAEVAVGSYLRFGATRSWDASGRYDYRVGMDAIRLAQHPWLIRHRAGWNRLFRRDFWLEQQVSFPEAESADLVPITRVLTAANRITLVPVIAYLHRIRPGRTDLERVPSAVADYLAQERECWQLVEAYGDPEVTTAYWESVLAEEAWREVGRFLRAPAASRASGDGVGRLIGELLGAAPAAAIAALTAEQRAVYGLVQLGRVDVAAALENPDSLDLRRAAEAVRAAGDSSSVTRADLAWLVHRHLLRRVIEHRPDVAQLDDLAAVLRELRDVDEVELAGVPAELAGQILHALLHGDGQGVLDILASQPVAVPSRDPLDPLASRVRQAVTRWLRLR